MCEEVQKPSIQVPKAMVATIFINTFAGLLFLIPIVFVLPNIQDIILLPQPVPAIIKSAVGSSGGAIGLLIPLMVLALLCGIGVTTASSRCTWAFARDGAIPGSKWWMKVNHRLDVPLNAMMLCMVVEIVLGLIYFGSTAAFNAFSGVGVICLTASYATPIAISMFTGRRQVKTGNFYLGKFGYFLNIVSIGKTPHLFSAPCWLFFTKQLRCSMVFAGDTPVLHALKHTCQCHAGQLRCGRVCRRDGHLESLVLGVGTQKLCRPTGAGAAPT